MPHHLTLALSGPEKERETFGSSVDGRDWVQETLLWVHSPSESHHLPYFLKSRSDEVTRECGKGKARGKA